MLSGDTSSSILLDYLFIYLFIYLFFHLFMDGLLTNCQYVVLYGENWQPDMIWRGRRGGRCGPI